MFGNKESRLEQLKKQSNIALKSDLLKNLSFTERYELLQLCHKRKYKSGEYIYYQNDPGTGMYFLEEGTIQLQVSENRSNPTADPDPFYAVVEAPKEIGVITFGIESRRIASAKCVTDCTVLGFFESDFETLKKRNPQTAVKFLEASSTRVIHQLDRALARLRDVTDAKTAFITQVEPYYTLKPDPEDPAGG
jgi:CRP/FNR family transcriptional regulator, cyclic AMP receptor protein